MTDPIDPYASGTGYYWAQLAAQNAQQAAQMAFQQNQWNQQYGLQQAQQQAAANQWGQEFAQQNANTAWTQQWQQSQATQSQQNWLAQFQQQTGQQGWENQWAQQQAAQSQANWAAQFGQQSGQQAWENQWAQQQAGAAAQQWAAQFGQSQSEYAANLAQRQVEFNATQGQNSAELAWQQQMFNANQGEDVRRYNQEWAWKMQQFAASQASAAAARAAQAQREAQAQNNWQTQMNWTTQSGQEALGLQYLTLLNQNRGPSDWLSYWNTVRGAQQSGVPAWAQSLAQGLKMPGYQAPQYMPSLLPQPTAPVRPTQPVQPTEPTQPATPATPSGGGGRGTTPPAQSPPPSTPPAETPTQPTTPAESPEQAAATRMVREQTEQAYQDARGNYLAYLDAYNRVFGTTDHAAWTTAATDLQDAIDTLRQNLQRYSSVFGANPGDMPEIAPVNVPGGPASNANPDRPTKPEEPPPDEEGSTPRQASAAAQAQAEQDYQAALERYRAIAQMYQSYTEAGVEQQIAPAYQAARSALLASSNQYAQIWGRPAPDMPNLDQWQANAPATTSTAGATAAQAQAERDYQAALQQYRATEQLYQSYVEAGAERQIAPALKGARDKLRAMSSQYTQLWGRPAPELPDLDQYRLYIPGDLDGAQTEADRLAREMEKARREGDPEQFRAAVSAWKAQLQAVREAEDAGAPRDVQFYVPPKKKEKATMPILPPFAGPTLPGRAKGPFTGPTLPGGPRGPFPGPTLPGGYRGPFPGPVLTPTYPKFAGPTLPGGPRGPFPGPTLPGGPRGPFPGPTLPGGPRGPFQGPVLTPTYPKFQGPTLPGGPRGPFPGPTLPPGGTPRTAFYIPPIRFYTPAQTSAPWGWAPAGPFAGTSNDPFNSGSQWNMPWIAPQRVRPDQLATMLPSEIQGLSGLVQEKGVSWEDWLAMNKAAAPSGRVTPMTTWR